MPYTGILCGPTIYLFFCITDVSSGYDSPVYNSGNTKESCHRKLQMAASSYDSDFSSEDSTQFSDSSSDDDDSANA
jgi:hypothetical protein